MIKFVWPGEGHAFISAIRKLKQMPDVIIVDGQGIAHPPPYSDGVV